MLQSAGTDRQRERWLPGLVSGEVRAGVGPRDLVLDGSEAEIVLLIDGDTAALLESFDAEPFDAIDPTRRFARVRGEGEALESDAAARFVVAVAAEVVGVCQRALEMTLDYVKERKQFGVPVGSFQAVSHRCAQMLLHTESARSAAYFGAWAADADPERLPEGAALAAAAAATGGREVDGLGDPEPRRDRLHLGGRRALVVQARRARPGAAGLDLAPSRDAGPDRCAAAGRGRAGVIAP